MEEVIFTREAIESFWGRRREGVLLGVNKEEYVGILPQFFSKTTPVRKLKQYNIDFRKYDFTIDEMMKYCSGYDIGLELPTEMKKELSKKQERFMWYAIKITKSGEGYKASLLNTNFELLSEKEFEKEKLVMKSIHELFELAGYIDNSS